MEPPVLVAVVSSNESTTVLRGWASARCDGREVGQLPTVTATPALVPETPPAYEATLCNV
jgi:hypothetical protein